MLAAHGYRFPQLEEDTEDIEAFVAEQTQLTSQAAREAALGVFKQLRSDARKMPRAEVAEVLQKHGLDLPALARLFRVPMAVVFRRIAVLSNDLLPDPVGLIVCDKSWDVVDAQAR